MIVFKDFGFIVFSSRIKFVMILNLVQKQFKFLVSYLLFAC